MIKNLITFIIVFTSLSVSGEMVFHISGAVTSFDTDKGYLDIKKGKTYYRIIGDEKFIDTYKSKSEKEVISVDYRKIYKRKNREFFNIMTNEKLKLIK